MRMIDAEECTSTETLSAFPVFEESNANVEDLKELIASCKTVDSALLSVLSKHKTEILQEKINTLKMWPGSTDSADKAFLHGVAKDLELLLAERVQHGKWSKLWNDYVCSICGCPASYCIESKKQDKTRFCQNCGARMGS